MRLDQLDEYVRQIQCVQRDFPRLNTLLALEVDYLPEHAADSFSGVLGGARYWFCTRPHV
jgi:hypothetical protein